MLIFSLNTDSPTAGENVKVDTYTGVPNYLNTPVHAEFYFPELLSQH